MTLQTLQISCLRHFEHHQWSFHPRINVIHGPNGSGKTTCLEAIYLLTAGHSFKTRETHPLVTQGHSELTIFGRWLDEQTVSLRKSTHHSTQVRINHQPCSSSSELARRCPTQVFYQDIFDIMDAGPSVRRSLLDWGMFHVKHDYLALWKSYYHLLKQRQALLKIKAPYALCLPWDKQLSDVGECLNELRQAYFNEWHEAFIGKLAQLTVVQSDLRYYRGWNRKNAPVSLLTLLKENYDRDCYRQMTHAGPHQADLLFETDSDKSKQILSRGQQKMTLLALKFAQADLLEQPCLYLMDDMTSELDDFHLQRLFALIEQQKGQFFFTTTMPSLLEPLISDGAFIDLAVNKRRLPVEV
jgi:DNA replication and repair protein RecF